MREIPNPRDDFLFLQIKVALDFDPFARGFVEPGGRKIYFAEIVYCVKCHALAVTVFLIKSTVPP